MTECADLLFELGTEELPPVALKQLSESLEREFVKGLDDAGLEYGEVSANADNAVTDGNLVTAPAWPAHPEWIKQFLKVLGTKIEP